jgi:hypothetical protein
MKSSFPRRGHRGNFKDLLGPHCCDEFFITLIGLKATSESHLNCIGAGVSSNGVEYFVGFRLKLTVRFDHLLVPMGAL